MPAPVRTVESAVPPERLSGSGLRVDVADVLRTPGASRAFVDEVTLDDTSVALAEVTGPVRIDVLLEGVLEGLVVSGSLAAEAVLRCRRCLDERPERVEARVSELFSDDPELLDAADVYAVEGVEIDLEQFVRDGIGLALPESPLLCDGDPADCPNYRALIGRGFTLPEDAARPDPRWAPLEGLFGTDVPADRASDPAKEN